MKDLQVYLKPSLSNYPTHIKGLFCSIVDRNELIIGYDTAVNCGWALREKEFYVWKDNLTAIGQNSGDKGTTESSQAYKLNAPTTGLVFTDKHVAFCKNDAYATPSVVVVAPEGNVRFWPSLEEKGVNLSMPLDGDVAVEVFYKIVDDCPSFVITTSSGDVYQVPLISANGSKIATGKLSIVKINSNGRTRLTGRFSRRFFKYDADKNNYLRSSFFVDDNEDISSEDFSMIQILSSTIRGYNVGKFNVLWEFDAGSIVAKEFLKHYEGVLNIDEPDNLHTRTQIICTFIDSSSVYLLFTIRPKTSFNSSVALYLGKVGRPHDLQNGISDFDWLSAVNLPSSIVQTISNNNSWDKIKVAYLPQTGLFIYSRDVVTNFKIETKTFKTVSIVYNCHLDVKEKCFGYKVVGDSLVCFAELEGPAFIRLLPIGFEASFVETKKMDEYLADLLKPSRAKNSLYKLLYDGFLNFCQFYQDDPKVDLLEEFKKTGNQEDRGSAVARMMKYIVNSSPTTDNSSEKVPVLAKSKNNKLNRSKDMLQIQSQLEDKLALCKIFIAFIKNQGLESDVCLGKTQFLADVVEMMELLQCAYALFECTSLEKTPYIYEVIHNAVNKRNERDQSLSVIQTFYKFVTEVDEIFDYSSIFISTLLKDNNRSSEVIDKILEVVGIISCILDQIKSYRSEEWAIVVRTSKVRAWTSRHGFLGNLLNIQKMMSGIIEDVATRRNVLKSFKSYYITIIEFILEEQAGVKDTVNSFLIRNLIETGFIDAGITNAEKYFDFQTLIAYAMGLDESDKVATLEKYKKKFASKNFETALYDYYRENQMFNELLNEKSPNVDDYLKSYDAISWMRHADNKEYGKAAQCLYNTAVGRHNDSKKEMLLLLGKLSSYCEDEENVNLIREFDVQLYGEHD
ncbi:Nucleoporin, Nup133/Nup155-like, C-terminal domain and WD40/YVTN repeat-like-containing domain-containing protein [Strongyloides ratti]|uniref:Nucleoporin, Nup133/Nup155-like, C-terminal domain and WD40/YVTN repeat-like-containing domain-containing protein n=1 Tax=Strongyloides ratti TaxID=34506 RepID=A0A090L9N0_STRRB|nr:Nucleoporin, Nup133/Nup155-like, C-terminal domain and WD40/YVTN repeat-like-containing domain-containing protein [Strongyloides ratti]CEF64838.1 Nucleoporin, Nup133/Nup155-like, C-terminal domain and WD40/YVTN repeat-like-containing domain-containing protein [Strongyloides ratti]